MTVTDPMRSASTSRRAALTLIDCWALGWRIRQLMRLIRSPIVAVTRRVCGGMVVGDPIRVMASATMVMQRPVRRRALMVAVRTSSRSRPKLRCAGEGRVVAWAVRAARRSAVVSVAMWAASARRASEPMFIPTINSMIMTLAVSANAHSSARRCR